jgi:1,4-dihydroxy-2-naphthoate octaprenyltransferase
MAARPKTLAVGLAPVLVGSALAAAIADHLRVGPFVFALLGALFIQVGANLSNDYSDARRGADTEDRLGPVRVTAGGLVPPKQVLIATYVTFGLAALCGVYLVAASGWQLLVVGVLSIIAGVLYTGGPRPYGYEGLGEVFVFLFFGVAAVAGSCFAQLERWPWEALAFSVPVGLIAAAVLVVNNVRDMDTDRRVGKRTLAVRLGRSRTRSLYAAFVYGAYIVVAAMAVAYSPWVLLAWLTLPLAARAVRTVRSHSDGPTLNVMLAETGRLEMLFCVLLAAGILLGG